jgi:trigger factor
VGRLSLAPAVVKTSVTELPESRVRVEAEVPAEEVERRVQQTARQLGRQMKLPGFRKGKVPPPMVLQRVGRAAVLDETVRGALVSWYVEAIDDAGIVPVGDPDLDLSEMPAEGQPLHFSIEIGVRPGARLGKYRGLEVGRREPEASEEDVERQLEALRDRLARLETVDQPAAFGDFLVVDFAGTVDGQPIQGGEARDELIELGDGRVAPEMEAALTGASAGDERRVEVPFPADHGSEQLAGKTGVFEVTVKEVKRKQLPELDDDFAADAAGFDTLAELKDDLRAKLEEADRQAVESDFREAALDAAVAEAEVDLPEPLVESRAREMWQQLVHALGHQGVSKEAYLRVTGKREEEIVADAGPEAERALRREAVLAAVIEVEGIEPSREDLHRALEQSAQREGTTPEQLVGRLRDAGRLDSVRRDVAARKALDLLASEAQPISVETAKARDKLWTPGKKEPEEPGGRAKAPRAGELWTPGS